MKNRDTKTEYGFESGSSERTATKVRHGSNKTALLIIVVYFLVMAAVAIAIDGRHVRFYMMDSAELTVECGEEYSDPGVYAVTVGRILGESARQLPVTVSGTVDNTSLGSYELKYSARYMLKDYSTSRTVTVTDTKPPQIILEHDDSYYPNWLDGYTEEGFTAVDLCDGDLTDRVQREIYEDKIVYTVTDSAGNTATTERLLDYAIGKPELVLNGSSTVEMSAYRIFSDPGCRAYDAFGNDMSEYIQVEGSVTPYTPGEYQLTYSISNAVGETVSVVRTVSVIGSTLPETVVPDEKTIYLTFDDGPGPYTDDLLDILAKYNVKATFFVTCLNNDYFDAVGRAYREGHSIGVHTATHNYYKVYDSEAAFFEDFNTVEDMIFEQTGSYTNLCRFPGGSSNTVSSFNPGIMTRLAKMIEDMGYKYFDWNVSSGDAGETTSTKKVAENIINGCKEHKTSIVLQHDIKDYSVDAVEKVITWGLKNGYSFRALDLTSPSSHHGIAN